MPYMKCPNCGTTFHVRVVDLEDFYKKFGRPTFESTSEELCFFCWKELRINDLVEVIKISDLATNVNIGSKGRIVEILQEKLVYKVSADEKSSQSQWSGHFRRNEIKFVYERPKAT
jgi:hypothetical protein